jgi:dolichol kinase
MDVEIKRKLVHTLGIFTIVLILVFGKVNASIIILFATLVGFFMAEYRKNRKRYKIVKIKPIDELETVIENELKTYERKNSLPFKGAIEFGLGSFLATILFNETIAIACIAVLSLADSFATLVGFYFGKYRLPINKKKSWEGSTTFFLVSFFILSLFTSIQFALLLALISTITEALPYADDNLSIPLVLGISMSLIL